MKLLDKRLYGIRTTLRLFAATACAVSMLAAGPAFAGDDDDDDDDDNQEEIDGNWSKGDVHKGEFHLTLTRGGAAPPELYIAPAIDEDCDKTIRVNVEWDEDDNEVNVHLEGENALVPHPTVTREEGVNWFPNPVFPDAKDIVDGRYTLWMISTSGPITNFYYSFAENLDLVGSEYDFDVPPPGTIAVAFPSLFMTQTDFFQPDDNGDLDYEHTFNYDQMLRGDNNEWSHHIVSFPPTNLCLANPFRLDLSTLRAYASAPQPAEDAFTFADFWRGGMLFDLTFETPEYHTDPPLAGTIGAYQGGTAVAGGIPNGWQMDIDAAFAGLAPPLRPFGGAGSCEGHFTPAHTPYINFCEPPPNNE